MAIRPPVSSAKLPYASARDNPERTASDMWGDMVEGRVMFFTKMFAGMVGPLTVSIWAFFTQKDVTRNEGAKVRYISDHMVDINERIEPKHHPMVRVPKRGDVIRRILYWGGIYPDIPVLFRTGDLKGAFKFLPVSIVGLTHMGQQFSNYMILYMHHVALYRH